MTNETGIQDVAVLLDRYLEISNHYARELRSNLDAYENTPSRLTVLIDRLEAIQALASYSKHPTQTSVPEEQALGQNIVPTADTMSALRISANEVLKRLAVPPELVPHNLRWLQNWLRGDVSAIAAGLPSFTFAWDKLIDLNRLTLVPDTRLLRVRDNVILATMEFERFILALLRLVMLVKKSTVGSDSNPSDDNPEVALRKLHTPLIATLDRSFNARIKRAEMLLQNRKGFLEEHSIISKDVQDWGKYTDALALVGLELGFVWWRSFANPSREHRKTIIMSMLVCSKLFLVESLWQNAKEFSGFAIRLTMKMNSDLSMDQNDGIAMLRFNQFWARYKLGESITEEVEEWDISKLHPRYSFMKNVLLRKFDDAIRILETLLPKGNSGKAGNFSIAEAEEWPILEDLRSSQQYKTFKEKLKGQVESRVSERMS